MVPPTKLVIDILNTAVQWASATRSRLVSYCRLFFTSRDDVSPASPSCLLVADDLPVVIDAPGPGDIESGDPVSPPGQLAAATQRRGVCIRGFAPGTAHPIAVLFQSEELGKAVLGLSVPIITGLLSNQYRHLSRQHASLIVLALCVGFTATWAGLMLRELWPRVACMSENIGVVSIFVGFFGLVASFLTPSLAWVAWLCCGLSCSPFFICMNVPDPANNRGLT